MNKGRIIPGQTIGIIGGGQLGRMMALSAREMGYKIVVLDPTPKCPAAQIADHQIVAAFNDNEAIIELEKLSDIVTYEFENINFEALHYLEKRNKLPQGSKLLKITQNRMEEKQFLNDCTINTVPFAAVKTLSDLEAFISKHGTPVVLKTCTGGYDGKGQWKVNSLNDSLEELVTIMETNECIVEKWITFSKEASIIVHRNEQGQTVTLPISENIHVNHILHQSIVPARIDTAIKQKIEKIAGIIANELQMVGTLAIEVFITELGDVFVNEMAPRPHNSGHYSIDACTFSQFDLHVRAICNWSLPTPELVIPTIMVNILGQHVEPIIVEVDKWYNAKLHLYGKEQSVHNRKMGHVNVLGSIDELQQEIKRTEIWSEELQMHGG